MERKKNSQWLFLANRPACRAGRPFGETLVEEHLNSYNSPFKFLASDERPKKREECIKEYDAETGNYYYCLRRLSERRSEWRGRHFRYYNPKWSIWLSVDPLAEKYPSISPYAYVANNPINAIDPDGRKIIFINGKLGGGYKGKGGKEYWNNSFVQGAKDYMNDNSVYYVNTDYGYLSSASGRMDQGYEWAKEN